MPRDNGQWVRGTPQDPSDRTGTNDTIGGLSRRQVLGTAATVAGTGLVGTGLGGAQTTDGPNGLDGRSWQLTWSDEFDGGSIDTSTWSFETGGGCGQDGTLGSCNWGNNEAQYYTNGDNAWVENGNLVIEAREEQVSGPDATYQYTSSRMVTAGSVSKQFGRIDVRARMPIGQGIWPALWMLPEPFVTWPDEGEIDIMEYLGHQPGTIHGTVHGPGYSGADGISGSYSIDSGTFADSFHVFSIVWEPDYFKWYVDGTQFHEATRNEVESAGNEWVFDDKPFHLLFNIAVGGSWPGYPDETTSFPQRMEVDYVRFFEEGEGDGGTPTDSPTDTPAPEQGPYNGPHTVPGTIEAEDFDVGGQGVAYNDTTTGNEGGVYRDTDVDIEEATEHGYNLAWIVPDEWWVYTVDVESGGTYDVSARVASNTGGGAFHVEVDGTNATGTVSFDATGGWQSWTTVSAGSVDLAAGEHTITVYSEASDWNLNYLTLAASDATDGLPTVGDNEGPPQDLNGDGVYMDVNGNGRLDNDDVVTYFEEMDSSGITNNVAAYDYNGNGRIDFDDVVTLFESL